MKDQFKNLLRKKDDFWRGIFCALYLRYHQTVATPMNADDIVDKSDVDELSKLCYETELIYPRMRQIYNDVKQLYQTRSPLWRYHFVDAVAKLMMLKLQPSSDPQTLCFAYLCSMEAKSFKVADLIASLDQKHQQLHTILQHKENTLFRNMVLILEVETGKELYYKIPQRCDFRELLEFYIPICGSDKLQQIASKACTADIKLSDDELLSLAMTYTSPYSGKTDRIPLLEKMGIKINYEQSSKHRYHYKAPREFPRDCLFAYVERRMNFLLAARKHQQDVLQNSAEEDQEDLHEMLRGNPINNTVFLDFNKSVIISTSWLVHGYFYAVVYIKKQPDTEIFTQNFIVNHNNLLYVVEFVDDLRNCCEHAKSLFADTDKLEKTLKYYNEMMHNKSAAIRPEAFHQKITEYLAHFAVNDEFFTDFS